MTALHSTNTSESSFCEHKRKRFLALCYSSAIVVILYCSLSVLVFPMNVHNTWKTKMSSKQHLARQQHCTVPTCPSLSLWAGLPLSRLGVNHVEHQGSLSTRSGHATSPWKPVNGVLWTWAGRASWCIFVWVVQWLLDSPRGTICRLIQIVLLLAHVKPSSTIQAMLWMSTLKRPSGSLQMSCSIQGVLVLIISSSWYHLIQLHLFHQEPTDACKQTWH